MVKEGELCSGDLLGEEMEVVVNEKVCELEDSLEVDFDYEFDAAKYFDFTKYESDDDIRDAQLWFISSSGYPPSPLIEKFDQETGDSVDGEFDSDYTEEGGDDCTDVSSQDLRKKGQPKSKCSNQPLLPKSSRLLKPTASQLARQSQQSAANPGRLQKASGDTSTKRQNKIEASDVKSCTRTKATVPREPQLATARRAQIHRRSKSDAQIFNCADTNVSLQDKSDRVSTTKALQSNKKMSLNKGDSGAFGNNKQESLVPRESKLTRSKRHSQNLSVELFEKKGFTNRLSSVTEENKVPDVIPKRPKSCGMEHSQSIGGLWYISKATHQCQTKHAGT